MVQPRHRRLAEIKRARGPARIGEAGGDLVDASLVQSRRIGDHGGQSRDVGVGLGQRRNRDPDRRRIEHRHVAVHVDDGIVGALRVEHRERGVDAVGAGRQLRIGQHCATARRAR